MSSWIGWWNEFRIRSRALWADSRRQKANSQKEEEKGMVVTKRSLRFIIALGVHSSVCLGVYAVSFAWFRYYSSSMLEPSDVLNPFWLPEVAMDRCGVWDAMNPTFATMIYHILLDFEDRGRPLVFASIAWFLMVSFGPFRLRRRLQTRCRRCDAALKGLASPECPYCGEPL